MHVPGLPNLPAPSPDMVENWRRTGNHLDDSWRNQFFQPPKIEILKPITSVETLWKNSLLKNDSKFPWSKLLQGVIIN